MQVGVLPAHMHVLRQVNGMMVTMIETPMKGWKVATNPSFPVGPQTVVCANSDDASFEDIVSVS